MMQPKITDWHGIYDLGWGDLLCPESYSHPAKMARGLVFKIVEYLLELERIRPGQTIVDPFGGIGTTALPTLLAGLNYVGVELEQKFVDLGRQNIEMWNQRFAAMPKWGGTAVMLQGDSRRLVDVVAQAGGVVSSPPYAGDSGKNDRTGHQRAERRAEEKGFRQGLGCFKTSEAYGTTPGQLGAMPEGRAIISSPPYTEQQTGGTAIWDKAEAHYGRKFTDRSGRKSGYQDQGDSAGQLSNLPTGDVSAVVSSPPWAGNSGGRGEASRNGIDPALFDRHQGGMVGGIGGPGNLAGMEPGEVEDVIGAAVVSSPPYENSFNTSSDDAPGSGGRKNGQGTFYGGAIPARAYGNSDGQLGTESGDTFWSAAKQILLQCAAILPPGAPAVWVVKSFVRSGAVVDFPGQWQALCEACGFETVEIVRAWLVKDKGTQFDLEGNGVKRTVKRASFFRRLHEQRRPDLAIDYEIVLFTRRVSQ